MRRRGCGGRGEGWSERGGVAGRFGGGMRHWGREEDGQKGEREGEDAMANAL